jgi:HEAT repeat protein
LDHGGPVTAFNAVLVIRRIGRHGESAVCSIVETLRRKNDLPENRRAFAALALGGIGPKAAKGVPELLKLLRDESSYARWAAAKALGEIGGSATSATPALSIALHDSNDNVRLAAALALWRVGRDSKEPVRVLTDLAKRSALPDAQVSAIRALGEIGPPAKAAVPMLEGLLKSNKLQLISAEALCQIDPDLQGPWTVLTSSLRDDSKATTDERFRSAVILASAGRDKRLAAKVLVDNLNAPAINLREARLYLQRWRTIKLMGVLLLDPDLTVPALILALKDDDRTTRLFAAQALGRIGSPAASAMLALNATKRDANIYVRRMAEWAIDTIQADEKKR